VLAVYSPQGIAGDQIILGSADQSIRSKFRNSTDSV
jgi:hypothetical protein